VIIVKFVQLCIIQADYMYSDQLRHETESIYSCCQSRSCGLFVVYRVCCRSIYSEYDFPYCPKISLAVLSSRTSQPYGNKATAGKKDDPPFVVTLLLQVKLTDFSFVLSL
jgi:hypothetical protein